MATAEKYGEKQLGTVRNVRYGGSFLMVQVQQGLPNRQAMYDEWVCVMMHKVKNVPPELQEILVARKLINIDL